MSARFAYSLNGENYVGSFDSREAAKAAALAKSSGMVDPPVAIFVGAMLDGDTHASGHARAVIDSMRRHARESDGTDSGRSFSHLSEGQLRDLDNALAKAITGWLEKNNLMPQPSKLGAISEHPVPLPHRELSAGTSDEVHDLGVAEQSA